jgi:hypothetical protein
MIVQPQVNPLLALPGVHRRKRQAALTQLNAWQIPCLISCCTFCRLSCSPCGRAALALSSWCWLIICCLVTTITVSGCCCCHCCCSLCQEPIDLLLQEQQQCLMGLCARESSVSCRLSVQTTSPPIVVPWVSLQARCQGTMAHIEMFKPVLLDLVRCVMLQVGMRALGIYPGVCCGPLWHMAQHSKALFCLGLSMFNLTLLQQDWHVLP